MGLKLDSTAMIARLPKETGRSLLPVPVLFIWGQASFICDGKSFGHTE